MDVVFVKTRWHYQSYTDFWAMVELAGYPTCYVDEVDVEAELAYVVNPLNGEWEPMLNHRLKAEGRKKKATMVSWTLEPPTKSDYLPNLRRTVDEGLVDWIWMGYRNLAQAADHARIRFVPVGSMDKLGGARLEPKYDVIHLSYPTHRRGTLYNALMRKGVKIAPNGWGRERDVALRSSRFLLNVHKDDGFQAYEPLRFAVAAAYGLPIISESCAAPFPYRPMVDFYEMSYDAAMKITLAALSQDYGQWAALGQRTRDRMTGEFAFDKCVEEAVCQL
jgi:hypothetical protein